MGHCDDDEDEEEEEEEDDDDDWGQIRGTNEGERSERIISKIIVRQTDG